MQQFVVKKANRLGEESWSTRVLTIDPAHHVLYLSRRGDVNQLDYHCMVDIAKVRWWPHYSWFIHSIPYGMADAPCTFCVTGATVQHGSASSPVSSLFHLRRRKMTPREYDDYVESGELLSKEIGPQLQQQQQQKVLTAATVTCVDMWMLRCMTREDIAPIQAALRAAVEDAACVKGETCISLAQSRW